MYLHPVTLLESAGFQFGLDYDDELLIEYPLEFDAKGLADRLAADNAKEIVSFLKSRALRSRQQFLGGPLDGQAHAGLKWITVAVVGKYANYGYHLHHSGPGEWAIYIGSPSDGRAFYNGTASSEAKARKRLHEILAARGSVEKQP